MTTCPTCREPDLSADELCAHRFPACLRCCHNGEHPQGYEDVPA